MKLLVLLGFLIGEMRDSIGLNALYCSVTCAGYDRSRSSVLEWSNLGVLIWKSAVSVVGDLGIRHLDF